MVSIELEKAYGHFNQTFVSGWALNHLSRLIFLLLQDVLSRITSCGGATSYIVVRTYGCHTMPTQPIDIYYNYSSIWGTSNCDIVGLGFRYKLWHMIISCFYKSHMRQICLVDYILIGGLCNELDFECLRWKRYVSCSHWSECYEWPINGSRDNIIWKFHVLEAKEQMNT